MKNFLKMKTLHASVPFIFWSETFFGANCSEGDGVKNPGNRYNVIYGWRPTLHVYFLKNIYISVLIKDCLPYFKNTWLSFEISTRLILHKNSTLMHIKHSLFFFFHFNCLQVFVSFRTMFMYLSFTYLSIGV